MRVLFTGASSVPGQRVLEQLLAREDVSEIWCALHKHDVAMDHPKLRKLAMDVTSQVCLDTIPRPLDLVIHFAAVTHAVDEAAYWEVNLQGTKRLAEQAQTLGCRRFFYVSTRCAVARNGATLALRLARKYKAAPLPVWWPAVTLILKALGVLGFHPATPDQISRLVGPKTASVSSEQCRSSDMIRFPQNAMV